MCTVPMAASVDDCRRIVGLSVKTGLKYLLAETVVYAPPPGRKPQACAWEIRPPPRPAPRTIVRSRCVRIWNERC